MAPGKGLGALLLTPADFQDYFQNLKFVARPIEVDETKFASWNDADPAVRPSSEVSCPEFNAVGVTATCQSID